MNRLFAYILLMCVVLLGGCNDETKVKSVLINPSALNMSIGDEYRLEMIVSPLSAALYNPTAWSSSNPDVASVDKNGVVTALYAGECVITGKAMHVENSCHVTVATPMYDLNFSNAVIFNEGKNPETGNDNLILRLYNDDLQIDSIGEMTGNGVFLSLSLHAPASDRELPAGEYHVEASNREYTVVPGVLREEDGKYYATGSFLGQYDYNGLSVLFLTGGGLTVADGDVYEVKCLFEGEKSEHVEASYSGNPAYYDTAAEHETSVFEYESVRLSQTSVDGELLVNHVALEFADGESVLRLTARVPKSVVGRMVQGNYGISDLQHAFTLTAAESSAPCRLVTGDSSVTIVSGSMTAVAQGETFVYSGSFFSSDGNAIVLQVRKQAGVIRRSQIFLTK